MATRNDTEMPLSGRQSKNEEENTSHRSSVGTVLRYQVQVCDGRNARDSHFVLCRQRILVCSRSRCLKPAVLSPPPTYDELRLAARQHPERRIFPRCAA